MNSLLIRLAVSCVRGWTRLYTSRLPLVFRETRRAEIESDLWEFQQDSETSRGFVSAIHVVVRLLLSVPADVIWRAEHMRVGERLPRRAIALTAAAATALLFAAFGVMVLLQPPELPQPPAVSLGDFSLTATSAPPPPPPPPPPSPRVLSR
jgi:hypothetical protein